MTRVVCLVLAVAAGLCAAMLLVLQPAVHQACEDKQRDWSVVAGLAALVALGAGSGAHFTRPAREAGLSGGSAPPRAL